VTRLRATQGADGPAQVPSIYEAIWALVRQIPPGRVMTYGQVATLLGSPRGARAVGYAMFFVRGGDVPWHRVVNARGMISFGGEVDRPPLQREMLQAEGVRFDDSHRIVEFERCLWRPERVEVGPLAM